MKAELDRTIQTLIASGGDPWEYNSIDIQVLVEWIEKTQKILSGNTVKLREECPNCHNDMKFLGMAYECKCGVVELKKTRE